MSGFELVLGGLAVLALLSVVVKARAGVRRAQAVAEIARVGASPVSLIGRVLVTALVIVGVQWLVITHSPDRARSGAPACRSQRRQRCAATHADLDRSADGPPG